MTMKMMRMMDRSSFCQSVRDLEKEESNSVRVACMGVGWVGGAADVSIKCAADCRCNICSD